MTAPESLKHGDRIGLVSTARKIGKNEIDGCVKTLTGWGLEVVTGDHIFSEDNQFGGRDEERTRDLQAMLDDYSVKAILCSRGGYGTVRLIDRLDFSNFIKYPKWIIGFSDITALHSHIHANIAMQTIHGPMAINFERANEKSLVALKSALFGEQLFYEFKPHPLNRCGTSQGKLTGGNLSVIYSLRGTPSDIDTKGKILFIEDLNEYLYHIDRMMMNLKRGGLLKNLAGLIVGAMTEMNDNKVPFGKNAEQIISDAVDDYDYPVCFGFPAGHIDDNMTLIFGRDVTLNIEKKGVNVWQNIT